MKRVKKNKSGFTLIELIVVMAMMGILMIGILNLVMPTNALYRDSTEYQYERATNETINNFIQGKVRYATDMIILNNCTAFPVGSGAYAAYSAIEIDNVARTYNNRTVKGKINVKSVISFGGATTQNYMNDGFYGEYNYIFSFSANNGNLTTNIEIDKVNRVNGVDMPEKKFDSSSTISLINISPPVGTGVIRIIDCSDGSQLSTLPMDLSVSPSASGAGNTYILYLLPDPSTIT